MRRAVRIAGVIGVVVGVLAVVASVGAQGPAGTLRLALVSQWIVNQQGRARNFPAVLDGGVVDRPVFWWQRGVIERRALVLKPIRVLSGPEAAALGGHGEFTAAIRPPRTPSAWVEVDVASSTGEADDWVVLEVGGEQYPIRQVLASLFVGPPGEALQELRLRPRAIVPGAGVPVMEVSAGRPVEPPGGGAAFHGLPGVQFLVVRSPIRVAVDRDMTTNGLADFAAVPLDGPDDWRDGDRVFVRVSAAALREGAPSIVMGWKDRTYRTDPDPGHNEPPLRN